MCGIAGAIGVVDERVRAALRRIDAAQAHRGPDGNGTWTRDASSSDRGVVFAHRRLAILDLDARSAQPMRDTASGNVITFNGEIYNYLELRRELEEEGFAFHTTSDTEVVLAAWQAWGESCLSRLAGMFAFALFEAATGDVVLARDRVGIKPLYYGLSTGGLSNGGSTEGGSTDSVGGRGTTLYFASEVRALLASDVFERRLEPLALATFTWHGFVCGDDTIVRGLRSLPPGTVARVKPTAPRVEPRTYWSPPRPPRREYAPEVFAWVLEHAVEQHLASDVPLAVFLSGGIDSSAIANLASRARPGIRTFNVAFDEAAFDESTSARAVAAAIGSQHHEVRLTADAFARDLPTALAALDQPTFDGVNSWFVSRAVRDAGVIVALAGTGGDELFGGYTTFRDLPRVRRASRALSMVPRRMLDRASRAAVSSRSRHGVAPQTRWGKLGDALSTRGSLVDLYQTAYALFSREFRAELLAPSLLGLTPNGLDPARAAALAACIEGRDDLEAISVLEIASFLSERLLRDTDAVSMAASIEVRVPLLDHRVIEAAMTLESSVRFAELGKKLPLRTVGLAGLDPALFDRPKSGFVLPIERWCRTTLASDVEAVLSDGEACRAVGLEGDVAARLWRAFRDGAPGIYWSRVWALYVLVRWSQRLGVRL